MLKIATWNVNSLRVRLPQVLAWLATVQPDILALQEIKLENKDFPLLAIQEAGYNAFYSGQKTYNGVALLSKTPAIDIITELPNWPDPQRRILGATIQGLRILNLYVPNGESITSDKYQYKLTWLDKLAEYIQQQQKEHSRLLLLGDFNIAPADEDIHDPKAWEGQVLASGPERQAFQKLLKLGLQDSFRLFEQAPNCFSWWDYRAAAFRRNMGLRIDHILVNQPLATCCHSCHIDAEPRHNERPSDHAPVVATFEL